MRSAIIDRNFEIFEDGTVINLCKNRVVKACVHKRSNYQVILPLSTGEKIFCQVGRLTYIAFNMKTNDIIKAYREFDKKLLVIHLDGDITNNHLSNLALMKVGN